MTFKGGGHDSAANHGGHSPKRLSVRDIFSNFSNGLPCGTEVMTADGALPVEYLEPGDRVITRGGMRRLRAIDTPAPGLFKLVFDREELVFAGGLQISSETGLPFAA